MLKFLFLIFTSFGIFAQQSFNCTLLSNLNQHSGFEPWSYSACWGYTAPDGREYAILGCFPGTSFVDITDENNIREVAFLPTPVAITDIRNAWREMKTYSHYAYIVSEGIGSGVQIVDLQYLPDSIRYVGLYSYPGQERTHTVSQSGNYLYLNGVVPGVAGTVVLDLTNPEHPVKRGEWREMVVHDSRIVNDTIWAANILDGYISIIDASNKDSLRTITKFLNVPVPGPHNCALTNDRKFLLVTDEINGNPRLLKIWNVENIFNPVQVAQWQPTNITTSIIHNVEVKGDTAVVAHYSAGIRLINISDRTHPQEIAWFDTYPQNDTFAYVGCWGVYMFPTGKIIGSDMFTGLYVIKMNSSPAPGVIPMGFSLYQNYPNPFNSSTKFVFELSRTFKIRIELRDVIGRKVLDLIEGEFNAGRYSADFNAYSAECGLPSGIYFIRMITGFSSRTIKIALVK